MDLHAGIRRTRCGAAPRVHTRDRAAMAPVGAPRGPDGGPGRSPGSRRGTGRFRSCRSAPASGRGPFHRSGLERRGTPDTSRSGKPRPRSRGGRRPKRWCAGPTHRRRAKAHPTCATTEDPSCDANIPRTDCSDTSDPVHLGTVVAPWLPSLPCLPSLASLSHAPLCLAMPAKPSPAKPVRAQPCRACLARPSLATPSHAMPAMPDHAMPSQALPSLPGRALPPTRLAQPCHACLTRPCLAPPYLVTFLGAWSCLPHQTMPPLACPT